MFKRKRPESAAIAEDKSEGKPTKIQKMSSELGIEVQINEAMAYHKKPAALTKAVQVLSENGVFSNPAADSALSVFLNFVFHAPGDDLEDFTELMLLLHRNQLFTHTDLLEKPETRYMLFQKRAFLLEAFHLLRPHHLITPMSFTLFIRLTRNLSQSGAKITETYRALALSLIILNQLQLFEGEKSQLNGEFLVDVLSKCTDERDIDNVLLGLHVFYNAAFDLEGAQTYFDYLKRDVLRDTAIGLASLKETSLLTEEYCEFIARPIHVSFNEEELEGQVEDVYSIEQIQACNQLLNTLGSYEQGQLAIKRSKQPGFLIKAILLLGKTNVLTEETTQETANLYLSFLTLNNGHRNERTLDYAFFLIILVKNNFPNMNLERLERIVRRDRVRESEVFSGVLSFSQANRLSFCLDKIADKGEELFDHVWVTFKRAGLLEEAFADETFNLVEDEPDVDLFASRIFANDLVHDPQLTLELLQHFCDQGDTDDCCRLFQDMGIPYSQELLDLISATQLGTRDRGDVRSFNYRCFRLLAQKKVLCEDVVRRYCDISSKTDRDEAINADYKMEPLCSVIRFAAEVDLLDTPHLYALFDSYKNFDAILDLNSSAHPLLAAQFETQHLQLNWKRFTVFVPLFCGIEGKKICDDIEALCASGIDIDRFFTELMQLAQRSHDVKEIAYFIKDYPTFDNPELMESWGADRMSALREYDYSVYFFIDFLYRHNELPLKSRDVFLTRTSGIIAGVRLLQTSDILHDSNLLVMAHHPNLLLELGQLTDKKLKMTQDQFEGLVVLADRRNGHHISAYLSCLDYLKQRSHIQLSIRYPERVRDALHLLRDSYLAKNIPLVLSCECLFEGPQAIGLWHQIGLHLPDTTLLRQVIMLIQSDPDDADHLRQCVWDAVYPEPQSYCFKVLREIGLQLTNSKAKLVEQYAKTMCCVLQSISRKRKAEKKYLCTQLLNNPGILESYEMWPEHTLESLTSPLLAQMIRLAPVYQHSPELFQRSMTRYLDAHDAAKKPQGGHFFSEKRLQPKGEIENTPVSGGKITY